MINHNEQSDLGRVACRVGNGGVREAPTWKVHRWCLSCRGQGEEGGAELWLACLTRLGAVWTQRNLWGWWSFGAAFGTERKKCDGPWSYVVVM